MSDVYLDYLEHGGPNPGKATGPSVMCSEARGSDGVCDMSGVIENCDCLDRSSACGSPLGACSDGDPDRNRAGYGTTTCLEYCDGTACTPGPECGAAHTDPASVSGVKFWSGENPRSMPQRRTAGPPGVGRLFAPLRSAAWQVDDPGQGDFAQAGARRLRLLSNSAYADEVFEPSAVAGIDRVTSLFACEIPEGQGWSSELPISGRCASEPETFCIRDLDCPTPLCDPDSFVYCHEADGDPHTPDPLGYDATGFLFTRPLEPGEQSGTCPPDCGRAADLDTFEIAALADGFGSDDPRIGAQLFFDSLEGPRVRAGDAIVPLRYYRSSILQSGDPRCHFPGHPVTSLSPGRCLNFAVRCDPTRPVGANGCLSQDQCRFCGGTPSVPPDPTNGPVAFGGNLGFDPAKGNPDAFPVGYDTHGLAELELPGRVARLNGVPSSEELPIEILLVPGPARSTFRADCANGCSSLGVVSGGAPGLGPTFTYVTAGDPVPHEPGPGAPPYAASLTVPPHAPGTPDAGAPPLGTSDFGVGEDGIPGCLEDNHAGSGTPCDERLGDPGSPGSTGLDDPEILRDFSPGADGTDLRPATAPRATLTRAALLQPPVFAGSRAVTSVRGFSSSHASVHSMEKSEWSFCPLVLREEGGEAELRPACSGLDLDGDGWSDELDGCPLVASLHPSVGPDGRIVPLPDSGGVASPANPAANIPDGIADVCQCGDVNDDGRVNGNDATLITFACINYQGAFPDRCTASSESPRFAWEKCDVGAGPPGPNGCNGNDATWISFTTLGLTRGLTHQCPAYRPL